MIICLISISDLAFAWEKSECYAKLIAPSVIRLDKQKIIPIELQVLTPEGEPYSGPVTFSAQWARFLTADGKYVFSLFTMEAANGKAAVTLSLEGRNEYPSPLKIFASLGREELLAEAAIQVLYPANYSISADVPAVVADGKQRPRVSVMIFDQYDQPLNDVDATVLFKESGREKLQDMATTDLAGVADISLPASTQVGYATCQVLNDFITTPQIMLLYVDKTISQLPLREIASSLGYRVNWDSRRRETSLVGAKHKIVIREGQTIAKVDGASIPLGETAKVRDGKIQVPALFVRTFLE
jgi:hypothetical protein